MRKESFISIIILIALWQIAAITVHNDVLIPDVVLVCRNLANIITDPASYTAVFMTLWRVSKGFALSLITSLVIAVAAAEFPVVKHMFEPLNVLTKSVPNISYLILCLIWLGSEGSVTAVSFFILFPVCYNQLIVDITDFRNSFKDVLAMYPEKRSTLITKLYLPELKKPCLHLCKTGLSLGFKVGVMAEILGQVKGGIGRYLYYAKLNLDTGNLFAWTLVIIFMCTLIDKCFDIIIRYTEKH